MQFINIVKTKICLQYSHSTLTRPSIYSSELYSKNRPCLHIRIIPWPSMDGSKAKQVYSARDTVGGNWSGVATNRQELFPFTLLWPIISKGWLLDKIRKVLPLARDVPSVTDKSPTYIMGKQSAASWLKIISSLWTGTSADNLVFFNSSPMGILTSDRIPLSKHCNKII